MNSDVKNKKFELAISIDEKGNFGTDLFCQNEELEDNDVYLALLNTFLILKDKNLFLLKEIMTASTLTLSDNPFMMKELGETLKGIISGRGIPFLKVSKEGEENDPNTPQKK